MLNPVSIRRSSRLIIVSPNNRLLLFRYVDEHSGAFWATVGGELQGAENYIDAAKRELYEETGFHAPIGRMIRERDAVYAVAQSAPARWLERYFVVHVVTESLPCTANWTDEEMATITAYRWWTPDELNETEAMLKPVWIPDVFQDAINAG
ncbi:NUDIX domain-containing protein [bacterium]|nr:NUDIX domain-containing protein [bacterium]